MSRLGNVQNLKKGNNGHNLPTIKQRKFIEEYVKTGNGAQSVLKAGYNTLSNPSSQAVENLKKPYIKEAIQKLLAEKGLEISTVVKHHKRNIEQENNLNVSQTAIADYYKITGLLDNNKENQSLTNIAFIIEN